MYYSDGRFDNEGGDEYIEGGAYGIWLYFPLNFAVNSSLLKHTQITAVHPSVSGVQLTKVHFYQIPR